MAKAPRQRIDPLNIARPIIDPATGAPTSYFMRLWEQLFGNESGTNASVASKADKSTKIIAGVGLTGGGDLSADRTLRIADTPVAPGSYTSANITVNQQGQITAAANGSGGGGSGLQYDSLDTQKANTASATLFATKGIYLTPLADMTIDSIVATLTLAAGGTYRARIYQVSGASTTATVTAIVDNGVAYVAPAAATLVPVRLDLSAPVNLVAGNLYVIAVSRTDAGNTFALPLGNSTAAADFPVGRSFPFSGLSARCQIALTDPIVTSVTAGYVANGSFNIGVIGDPNSIT